MIYKIAKTRIIRYSENDFYLIIFTCGVYKQNQSRSDSFLAYQMTNSFALTEL